MGKRGDLRRLAFQSLSRFSEKLQLLRFSAAQSDKNCPDDDQKGGC
ncbi:hypothetical protein SAMN03080618_01202 [Aquamicrobium aerolatum DSM 21857]|uniref:Uncharacterized protein n=1 Tax=Aquamicrobium aerolatum DSM 21857 TaxID=1121003 RepID=A0A1I3KHK3_9HYPH|nr:hypothetical protein SAMN03080618_01202 [Aquamicrobium aerolatum DSM 21857]